MKFRKWLIAAGLSLPFWIGLVLYILFYSEVEAGTVLNIRIRIDPSSLSLTAGTLLTLLLLGGWIALERIERRAKRVQTQIHHEAAQMRRRFLSQLDHELKNPLTALQAEIAYLSDSQRVENYAQAMSDMAAQVERVGRLVTDLRKLAELEELKIDPQAVNMGELLNEVMEAIQGHPGYQARKVRLLSPQDPWHLPSIPGDRGLLWLACYNLLDNALKFTPEGAAIEVRAFEVPPWLVVEVADNGPGISDDDLPHIFEDLYRGANARNVPGSGLGLALVRAIMIHHAGSVTVRSRQEQGTIFTLRLPLHS
jgi:two-component system OmpR family sensor kinase